VTHFREVIGGNPRERARELGAIGKVLKAFVEGK
jgi:hypothetical protein